MAGANVVEVGDQNFEVSVLGSDVPVVVDFWAEWCGPCRALDPTVEKLAEEYKGRLKVAKLNVDFNPEVAMKFKISAIPTLIGFKGGEVVNQIRGPRSRDLKNFFESVSGA